MPWCVPITWDSPFAAQFSGSPFGGSAVGPAAVIPAGGTTEDVIKFWNDNNIPEGIEFSIVNGCICVEATDGAVLPTGIKVGFDPGDPTPTSGNHTANFADIDKNPDPPADPKLEAIKQCISDLFGCPFDEIWPTVEAPELNKEAVVAAIQAGIGGPGEPTPETFSATILGNALGVSWKPGDPVPTDLVGPINPSCDGEDFGTLVIDLGLPATVQPGPASTTFTILDASAGWGTTAVVDKSTGTTLGQTYPSGAGGQGNNTPVPFDHTLNFTIPAGADPTQICMVINAFGAASWENACDEIGPGETIVTTAPSECAANLACLEELIGCSLADMLDIAMPGIADLVEAGAPRVRVCGCGNVAGSGIYDGEGFTVLKTGTGCYEVSFQPPAGGGGAVVPQFSAQTPADGDDVNLTWTEIGTNTYKVLVTEQDDGAGDGDLIDIGFSVLGICCDSAIGEAPPGGVVTEGPVTIDNNTGTVTIVNNTNTAQTYTIEDANGTQEVTVAANSTQTITGLSGAITVGAGTIGGAVGGVKALVGVKGFNREAPGPVKGTVGTVVGFLPLEGKASVTVNNETGKDAKIQVQREADEDNPSDANFTAKGAEGETISTTKSYALVPGGNTIKVVDKATKLVVAQRSIEYTPAKETKR